MSKLIATLENIQKATSYGYETIRLNATSGIRKLNVPIGARTALLVFESENGDGNIIQYLETDDSLDINDGIFAENGLVKELAGDEMHGFRAISADGQEHLIKVTYTR